MAGYFADILKYFVMKCRLFGGNLTPPSSVVINMQGLESGDSEFETCSGAWFPRQCPCGVAFNTLVNLKKLAGEIPSKYLSFFF